LGGAAWLVVARGKERPDRGQYDRKTQVAHAPLLPHPCCAGDRQSRPESPILGSCCIRPQPQPASPMPTVPPLNVVRWWRLVGGLWGP